MFWFWSIYNNLFKVSLEEKGYAQSAKYMAHTLAVNYTYGTWLHTVNGSSSENPNYTL